MILPFILFISVALINTITRSNSSRKLFFFLYFQVTVHHWGTSGQYSKGRNWNRACRWHHMPCPHGMDIHTSITNQIDYSQFVEDIFFNYSSLFSDTSSLYWVDKTKHKQTRKQSKTGHCTKSNFLFLKFEVRPLLSLSCFSQ